MTDDKREQIKEYVQKEDCVWQTAGVIVSLTVWHNDISMEEAREIVFEVINEHLGGEDMGRSKKIVDGFRQLLEIMNDSWEKIKNED